MGGDKQLLTGNGTTLGTNIRGINTNTFTGGYVNSTYTNGDFTWTAPTATYHIAASI